MSLILDALRKLERERDANESPGVLVVGSVPWGQTSRARRIAIVAGGVLVVALAMLAGWLLRPMASAPAAVAPSIAPAPAAPTPTPVPSATPPSVLPAAVAPSEPPAPPIHLVRPLPTPRARSAAAAPDSADPASSGPASAGASAAERSALSQPAQAVDIPQTAPPTGTQAAVPGTQAAAPPPVGAQAAAPPAPAGEPRLNAISRRDGRAVALINDRLVYEGDSFDGIKVIRIGDTEVEVEVKGERRILRF